MRMAKQHLSGYVYVYVILQMASASNHLKGPPAGVQFYQLPSRRTATSGVSTWGGVARSCIPKTCHYKYARAASMRRSIDRWLMYERYDFPCHAEEIEPGAQAGGTFNTQEHCIMETCRSKAARDDLAEGRDVEAECAATGIRRC